MRRHGGGSARRQRRPGGVRPAADRHGAGGAGMESRPGRRQAMIRRLLIANRGEIAVRVARTCRERGIDVVAVYSTADRDAAVLALADASVCIGPPSAKDSYLNIPNIVEAA